VPMLCTPTSVLSVGEGCIDRKLCTPIRTQLGYAGRMTELERGREACAVAGAHESASSALHNSYSAIKASTAPAWTSSRGGPGVQAHVLQHFTGKDELIARNTYADRSDILPEVFDRTDLTPRERLLAASTSTRPCARSSRRPSKSTTLAPRTPTRLRLQEGLCRAAHRNRARGPAPPTTNSSVNTGAALDGAFGPHRVLDSDTFATAAAIAVVLIDSAIPIAAVPPAQAGACQPGRDRVPDPAASSAEVDAEEKL